MVELIQQLMGGLNVATKAEDAFVVLYNLDNRGTGAGPHILDHIRETQTRGAEALSIEWINDALRLGYTPRSATYRIKLTSL